MFTDRELRAALRRQLEDVKNEYGEQVLPHLFKRLIPNSWSQAQILNCLVEYGLRDDCYIIKTGLRRGEHVDFFSAYPEDWMKIVSCEKKPRYDLKALEKLGFINELSSRRLALSPRKCTTIRMNWLALLQGVRQHVKTLDDYKSWSDPKYVKPVEHIDPAFEFEAV